MWGPCPRRSRSLGPRRWWIRRRRPRRPSLTQEAAGSAPHIAGRIPRLLEPGARRAHESGRRRVRVERHDDFQVVRTGRPAVAHARRDPGVRLHAQRRQGSHYDFNAIDGTRVQTVGSNAEMPRRGLLVDAVVKSGGNDFHGHAVVSGRMVELEGDNIDDELQAAGHKASPALHNLFRTSAGAWAGNHPEQALVFRRRSGMRTSTAISWTCSFPTARRSRRQEGRHLSLDKVSYQVSAGESTSPAFTTWTTIHRAAGREPVHPTGIDGRDKDGPVLHGEGRMAGRARQFAGRARFSTGAMGLQRPVLQVLRRGSCRRPDIATLLVTGNLFGIARPGVDATAPGAHQRRRELLQAGYAGGNHEFKAGVDHLYCWVERSSGYHKTGATLPAHFNNGAPFQLGTKNSRRSRRTIGEYIGVYGQDAWTIARRLTLNLGLRVDRDTAWRPSNAARRPTLPRPQCWDRDPLKSSPRSRPGRTPPSTCSATARR